MTMRNALNFAGNSVEAAARLVDAEAADDVEAQIALAEAAAVLAVASELSNLRACLDLHAAAGAFLSAPPASK